MKLEKLPSRVAKAKILKWLRLDQRCAFIATEVGGWSADCLGVNEKKIIEVEVKVDKGDLLADHQKNKHVYYTGKMTYYHTYEPAWYPTHFYYAVPTELVEVAKQYLIDRKLDGYGIIDLEGVKVIKRAKWLHKREPGSKIKFHLALRMGSELIRFHEAWI